MEHKNSICKFSTLLGVAALMQIPIIFAQDSSDNYDLKTIVSAPSNLEKLSVTPIFNKATSLLFFNGSQNGHQKGGYYKLNSFDTQWGQYHLPITANSPENSDHGIIAAVDSVYEDTVVLSFKKDGEKTTQYLSNTVYGSDWITHKILLQQNFTNLVTTAVYDHQNFVAYGENHQSILVSSDGNAWGHYAAPNSCYQEKDCTFSNKHFAGVYNGYLLLQSTARKQAENTSINTTNTLFFTQDFYTWYTVETPFNNDEINKVFKTKQSGLIASVTSKENGGHKLWYTKDYKNWQNFELSKDAKVLDAKTGYKHYITLSLNISNKSDIVVLDPNDNTQHVFASFEGEITSMDWYNNSLYLAGNFVNFRDNGHVLLVNMTKKASDENKTDKPQENDTTNNSENQITINLNHLKTFSN